jgi:hypothetical protein
MVKRSRQTGRPAGRRPGARGTGSSRPGSGGSRPARPAGTGQGSTELEPNVLRSSTPPSGLTADEEARAAALEAEIVEREQAAARAAAALRRPRTREAAVDPNLPLSVRAAHEYAYVARDVRRIGLTAGLMFGVLVVLHVLVNVAGVVRI